MKNLKDEEDLYAIPIVYLSLAFLSFISPFSTLVNDLIYDKNRNPKGLVATELYDLVFMNIDILYIFGFCSILTAGILTVVHLTYRRYGSFPDSYIIAGLVIIVYFIFVQSFSYILFSEIPTFSSIGLNVVQILLLIVLSHKVTRPLEPSHLNDDNIEEHLANHRHQDSAIITLGAGLIITILLGIAPADSDITGRFVIVLLTGPIALLLISIFVAGVAQRKYLEHYFI